MDMFIVIISEILLISVIWGFPPSVLSDYQHSCFVLIHLIQWGVLERNYSTNTCRWIMKLSKSLYCYRYANVLCQMIMKAFLFLFLKKSLFCMPGTAVRTWNDIRSRYYYWHYANEEGAQRVSVTAIAQPGGDSWDSDWVWLWTCFCGLYHSSCRRLVCH